MKAIAAALVLFGGIYLFDAVLRAFVRGPSLDLIPSFCLAPVCIAGGVKLWGHQQPTDRFGATRPTSGFRMTEEVILRPAETVVMTEEFVLRLAETVAWCGRHARPHDADTSTRSPALRPPVMTLPQSERLGWLLEQSGVPQAAVEAVCQARRRELDRLGIPVVPVGPDLAGGRILFTIIDTDSCQAAIEYSKGFYDLDDLPGWDTWFWHRPTDRSWGAIWCWVPGPLIELATRGMDVIPVLSVEWAEPLEWPKRD